MMKCDKCKVDFPENKLDESHDIPCYLFEGNRKGRKNQADKFGRHWLCRGLGTNNCHENYEQMLNRAFKKGAISIAKEWFDDTKAVTS